MTPAPLQLASPRVRKTKVVTAVLCVLLLAALFLPARGPVTHSLAIEWRPSAELAGQTVRHRDRKSTRLNSSHEWISYAVFCLKKKKNNTQSHALMLSSTP